MMTLPENPTLEDMERFQDHYRRQHRRHRRRIAQVTCLLMGMRLRYIRGRGYPEGWYWGTAKEPKWMWVEDWDPYSNLDQSMLVAEKAAYRYGRDFYLRMFRMHGVGPLMWAAGFKRGGRFPKAECLADCAEHAVVGAVLELMGVKP